MESQPVGVSYSYRRFVCLDCNRKNLLDPQYPLVCPDCQSRNVRDPADLPRAPEPVYALEGFYSMKPHYCHQCHKKSLISTGGPFVCPECGSQSVELITEQLKREDPHFQAILGHPKEEPPCPLVPEIVPASPLSPFAMMGFPFGDVEPMFSVFPRPRDLFRETFSRRGTPFSTRQSHLLDHFFNEFSSFDTVPSMRAFFSPRDGGFPDVLSFEDLLMHMSQRHPEHHSPANPEVVRSLRVVTVDQGMEARGDVCAVCQETLKTGEQVKLLPCTHLFHPGCIDPWLNVKNTCPVCRKEIGG